MAVNHREDSIQLIRDTEGIDNKDRVRILSPDADPPEEVTDVTKHALYMDMKNEPGDGEPYEYEFACCTGRRFIPQRAGDANKLEGKTSAEVKALFADGRAVFAGSGTSVTLDAKGDRVHSIIVNGFTKQTGSGTPSLENQMPITTGGLRLFEVTLTGNEQIYQMSASDGKSKFYQVRLDNISSVGEFIAMEGGTGWHLKTLSNKFAPGNPYSEFGKNLVCSGKQDINGFNEIRIGFENDPGSGRAVQDLLKKYAAEGKPLIVWCPLVDESKATGTYIPIIGTGGEYSAKCVKITDHLCAGDKFISRILSGCDKKIVIDGTQEMLVDNASQFPSVMRFSIQLTDPDIVNPFALSERLPYSSSFTNDVEYIGVTSVKKIIGAVYKSRLKSQDKEGVLAYFTENPLPVWYKSTEYTKAIDKDVALETHQQAALVLDGTENVALASTGYIRIAIPVGAQKPKGGASSTNVCSAAKFEYNVNGAGFYMDAANNLIVFGAAYVKSAGWSSADDCKAYLTAKYAAGTPVTIVYELATPLVYAHEPVDFEFVEGEDGVFTITGEADGTLDVYYKALQDGGDADKLGGKLPEYYAAAANALGQYTHTKSGTVHELTGTGDNIRFVATADFAAGDTVKVNGTTCTASTMSGDALWAGFFKSGAVVVCYRTGNALNFSGGGLAAAEAAKITPENLKTGVSVTVNGKTVAGTFTADGTAAAGDMLLGKTGYVKGQKVTGTIPSKAAASYKPGTSAQTIKAAQYLSGEQTIEGDAALIAANIKYGASIFDVDGSFTSDANAVAAEILTGKIGYVKGQKVTGSMPNQGAMWEKLSINGTVTIPAGYHNGQGKVTQSIPTKGAASYKPGTSAQTILSGQYLTGNQTIQGDGNLVAGNIRSGVSIFGVAGSFMEGSGGYLYMGQRNNTAMYGYAFGSASYSNGIRIGRSGNYLLVMFGYNETGYTGRMKVNGADVFAYGLNPAAVHTTTKWLNAGDIVTISADEGVNYALTGFVYNT